MNVPYHKLKILEHLFSHLSSKCTINHPFHFVHPISKIPKFPKTSTYSQKHQKHKSRINRYHLMSLKILDRSFSQLRHKQSITPSIFYTRFPNSPGKHQHTPNNTKTTGNSCRPVQRRQEKRSNSTGGSVLEQSIQEIRNVNRRIRLGVVFTRKQLEFVGKLSVR